MFERRWQHCAQSRARMGCGSSKPRGGFEIATTSFHPTNHIPILSIRFPF
jgi:hypothetical protein